MARASEVRLRDLAESDVNAMMVWASDPEVTRALTWEPYTCTEDAVAFIRSVALPHPWFKAICLDDGVAIGSITLTPGTGEHSCRAVLGYVLARRYWGQGITTRATQLAVEACRRDLPGVARIEAIVATDNLASLGVLRKAGFVDTGVQRNYLLLKGRIVDCHLLAWLVD